MFHAHTTRVLDEWTRRRGPGRRLPARTDLSPATLGPLLGQVFILADEGRGDWRFRIAGAVLAELHAGAQRGARAADLFAAACRPAVARALACARRRATPCVLRVGAEVLDDGRPATLELLLAPVTGPTEAPDRMLGLCQPLTGVRWRREPLGELQLLEVAEPRPAPTPPRLVVDNPAPPPLG